MLPLIACKMIKLTLDHGLCEDSIFGFVQYAAVICNKSTDFQSIQEVCRIGKTSMRLQKRFGLSTQSIPKVHLMYFGFAAVFTEPLQQCIENLYQSFKGKQVGLLFGLLFSNVPGYKLILMWILFCTSQLECHQEKSWLHSIAQ